MNKKQLSIVDNYKKTRIMKKDNRKQQVLECIGKNEQESYVGKRRTCFFRGNIYHCEIKETIGTRPTVKCFIEELGRETCIHATKINWSGNAEVEERWLNEYDAKQDRKARIKEVENEQRQKIKNILYIKTHRYIPRQKKRVQQLSDVEEQILNAQKQRLSNLCSVGSKTVKHLLHSLSKSGNKEARMYWLALEVERVNLHCKKIPNVYRKKLLCKRYATLMAFLELCKEEGFATGTPLQNPEVVCVCIPGCPTLAYPFIEWRIKIEKQNHFSGEWDGKHRMNIRHLENAISAKYGEMLQRKYPQRFSD